MHAMPSPRLASSRVTSPAVEDASPRDTVLDQEPAPDTEVAEGSPVDLVLSAGPSRVTVPDVRDLPESDAVGALEDAGLVVADTQTRANDDIAAGNALRTDPEAGSEVDPGSEVTLFLSSGAAARGRARRSWVSPAGTRATSWRPPASSRATSPAVEDASPRDTVLDQEPAPDTEVAEGSPVDLVLSAGPSRVTVPDVRDLPEADAVGALEDAGLVVADTQTRANDDIAAGNALRTDPEAGSEVAPGSEVTLFSRRAPQPVAVPDARGSLPRGRARRAGGRRPRRG